MSRLLPLLILMLSITAPAAAYVGPGLGLGVIATFLGTLSAIILSLVGMVWFPLKRLFRSWFKRDDNGGRGMQRLED
jgi:hypothetical protein